jgi:hypothetical protein
MINYLFMHNPETGPSAKEKFTQQEAEEHALAKEREQQALDNLKQRKLSSNNPEHSPLDKAA